MAGPLETEVSLNLSVIDTYRFYESTRVSTAENKTVKHPAWGKSLPHADTQDYLVMSLTASDTVFTASFAAKLALSSVAFAVLLALFTATLA